ncbi:MAG TPA: hypothetical protein VHC94_05220 [Nitrobacter sp.]|jgi:hypothetical protein|nr:hypothetical protein [Nitrobacter sp.]
MTHRTLRRDIVVVIAIKLVIVLSAAFFVFGPHQRPQVNDRAVESVILGSAG